MSRFTTVQAKFLLGVLPVVILVAFIFSAILGFQDYQNAHQVLKAKQRQLPQVYAVALAALSQNFQKAWVSRVIGSLALDPDVADAAVLDDEDNVLAQISVVKLQQGERRNVVEELIVDDTKAGRMTIKGKLKVAFHERALDKSIADRVGRSAMLVLLLVAAVVLAALIANRIIIGRPLERFLQAIRRADEEGIREPVRWSSRDEIGRVILAYNKMLEKLTAEESSVAGSHRGTHALDR